MTSASENERPVAPGPPWNRVSPVNTAPRSGAYRQTAPGAWPGVCSTRSVVPPTSIVMPSARSRSHSWASTSSGPPWVSSQTGRSSGCSMIGAPTRSRRAGATRHVVVVGVGAHDRLDRAVADHGQDVVDRVRGVDDHALVVVADHPDVVVDVEGLPVEAEGAAGRRRGRRGRSSEAPPPSAARRRGASARTPPRCRRCRSPRSRTRRGRGGPGGRGRRASGSRARAGSRRTSWT